MMWHRVCCACVLIRSNWYDSDTERVAAMPVVELSITDDSQLGSLESILRREMPEVIIGRLPGKADPGVLGWEDVLTLAFAGISALVETVEVIRSYLDSRSREAGVTITATN